jgi:hypothetical protein
MSGEQTDQPKSCWIYPTPGRLLALLLLVEATLFVFRPWLSKGWPLLIAVACVGGAIIGLLLGYIFALLFRWRFQFSIRSLLLLTVAVAVLCSWLTVEMKRLKQQKESVSALRKCHVFVAYDYQMNSSGIRVVKWTHLVSSSGTDAVIEIPNVPAPAWLQDLLGDDFFGAVVNVNYTGKERIFDQDLNRTTGFFSNMPVTDFDLKPLEGLKELRYLHLENTPVSDSDLVHLEELKQLRELHLSGTAVSDQGLEHLKNLTRLQILDLRNTTVTDAGVAKFQKALPGVRIKCQKK